MITTPDIIILTSLSLSVVSFPQTHAHSSLVYLVSLLGSMEHSFHHTLLLEIRALTDRYPSLLGGCGKDIYRMSNSFTAIARLLGRRLEESTAMHCRCGGTYLQAVFSCSYGFLSFLYVCACPKAILKSSAILHAHVNTVVTIQ